MPIRGLLYLYILIIGSVGLISYKKSIYLIWMTLLFVPTIVLEQSLKFGLSAECYIMYASVFSELVHRDRRQCWISFFTSNQNAVILYLLVSLTIIFLSQTVPIKTQFQQLLTEIAMLVFVLQTFLLVTDQPASAFSLRRIVCWVVIFNMFFCLFFEVMLGVNPAGMPLYILLGVDDNEFITDMIDVERGGMSFRAQTVYRHPLSLGQYMLIILPVFLMKGKQTLKLVYAFFICSLIVLSGSRGAMAPMILILLLSLKSNIGANLRKFSLFLMVVAVAVIFVPDKQWKHLNKEIEPFVASIQFWDDEKQKDNDIEGSSMELRINQFEAALDEISDNPIMGRGYGYRDYYIVKHNALHPDLLGFESVLLLYLVERGWLGLLFFFVMVGYIYKLFKKETDEETIIRYIFISYILSIIMTGVRPLSLLFVCLACLIAIGISTNMAMDHKESVE